jgi:hypothetical protein
MQSEDGRDTLKTRLKLCHRPDGGHYRDSLGSLIESLSVPFLHTSQYGGIIGVGIYLESKSIHILGLAQFRG